MARQQMAAGLTPSPELRLAQEEPRGCSSVRARRVMPQLKAAMVGKLTGSNCAENERRRHGLARSLCNTKDSLGPCSHIGPTIGALQRPRIGCLERRRRFFGEDEFERCEDVG